MRPEEFYNKLHTHLNGQQWEAVCVRPAKGIVFHGWKSHSVRV